MWYSQVASGFLTQVTQLRNLHQQAVIKPSTLRHHSLPQEVKCLPYIVTTAYTPCFHSLPFTVPPLLNTRCYYFYSLPHNVTTHYHRMLPLLITSCYHSLPIPCYRLVPHQVTIPDQTRPQSSRFCGIKFLTTHSKRYNSIPHQITATNYTRLPSS